MTDKVFTRNWMRETDKWAEYLAPWKGKPCTALEIGSFEGRSACWLMDNILTHPKSKLVCVDPYWYDGDDPEEKVEAEIFNTDLDLKAAQKLFYENAAQYGNLILHYEMPSVDFFLAVTYAEDELGFRIAPVLDGYHFVCIDGAHAAFSALQDIVLSWTQLRPGGRIVLDDTDWKGVPGFPGDGPKRALDAFLSCCKGAELLYCGGIAVIEKRV